MFSYPPANPALQLRRRRGCERSQIQRAEIIKQLADFILHKKYFLTDAVFPFLLVTLSNEPS